MGRQPRERQRSGSLTVSAFPWFRWYSGSVTDPKFQLVARRAGVQLPAVIAVWACLLETASQAEDRGCFGCIDTESLDVLFGFADGDTVTRRILTEFETRGMTKEGRVTAWDKRQPKREREDKTGAARQRAYRTRQSHVTPSNASPDQKQPRGDKRRINTPNPSRGEPEGFAEFYQAYPRKEGRARAAKAFEAVNAPLETLLRALAEQTQTEQWQKDGGRFIPLPASWLNGRRWEDVVRPTSGPSTLDPDSRAAVEAEGLAKGLGKWNEATEQWGQYKARVRGGSVQNGGAQHVH